jgi:hypothetical protein
MRESVTLFQEIAIVMWVTCVANAATWWVLEDRLFDAVRRRRSGTSEGGIRLILGILGRPKSGASLVMRDVASRLDAHVVRSADEEIEKQRRLTLMALVTAAATVFFGFLLVLFAFSRLRVLFPGTLIAWSAATDVILMTVWALYLRRSRRRRRDSVVQY